MGKSSKWLIHICIITFFLPANARAQSSGKVSMHQNEIVQEFSHKDLSGWASYGLGAIEANHGQTLMHETEGSVGYMLVSPESYGKNTRVSFDVMTLNPATVLVVEMNAHTGDDYTLNLAPDYDGNVQYLFSNVRMYMFAFHNAAHNKPGPFVRKYPEPGTEPLARAEKQYMQVGRYHQVEMGLEEGKIWFRVDGKKVLHVKDGAFYEGGKVILRIRGTGHETASCLLRNLKIYSRD